MCYLKITAAVGALDPDWHNTYKDITEDMHAYMEDHNEL